MDAACVVDLVQHIDRDSFKDENERTKAKFAAMALLARIETPWETALRLFFMEV